MDARIVRALVLLGAGWSMGAGARTEHFIVEAPTPQLAQQVATTAENYRRDLAMDWLGRPLPQWAHKCPIQVVLHPQASGETSFEFPVGGGHPLNWRMMVRGTPERILDSVLPHEILHTIFATHFENPLPRWADEGACTTVEGRTERGKHDRMLIQFLKGEDGIPFNEMFRMREYPRKILPLYSQGYSVASYLIKQGGRRKFVDYVGEGMRTNNWTASTKKHYGFDSLSDLQVKWVAWVAAGSRPIGSQTPASLAAVSAPAASAASAASAPSGVAPASRIVTPPIGQTSVATRPVPRFQPGLARSNTSTMVAPGPTRLTPQAPRGLPATAAKPLRTLDDSGWYARTARASQQQGPTPAAPRRVAISKAPSYQTGTTLLQWSRNETPRSVVR